MSIAVTYNERRGKVRQNHIAYPPDSGRRIIAVKGNHHPKDVRDADQGRMDGCLGQGRRGRASARSTDARLRDASRPAGLPEMKKSDTDGQEGASATPGPVD